MSKQEQTGMQSNKLDFKDPVWQLYERYLIERESAWSPSAFKSEASRLKKIIFCMKESGLSGPEFYRVLSEKKYGSYTIKTMFIRAMDFYNFGLSRGVFTTPQNPFQDHLERAKRQFNGAYKKERLNVDYYEVERRIATIIPKNVREFCLALLNSGLRIEEAYNVDTSQELVIGKGLKERPAFFNYFGDRPVVSKVRAELKKIGLKPHTLRKVLATQLARKGLSHADIMEIFGWSSISTAESYFQPIKKEELKQKLLEAIK